MKLARPSVVWLLAAVLGAAAGCSIPDRPAWWDRPQESPSAPTRTEAAKTGAAGPPVRQVSRPWRAGMPQYGLNIYWENTATDTDEVVRAKARRVIDYAIDLNANAVAISFPIYTKGIRANSVFRDTKTPSPRRIAIFLKEAAASRLRVSIRPLLDERNILKEDATAWRGTIAPTDRNRWFTNYSALLRPYVRAAQAGGAATFVVATELSSLQTDPAWHDVIRGVRGRFSGEVAYSANFDTFSRTDRLPPADVVGLDAYFPLRLDDNATVRQLADGWRSWLRRQPQGAHQVLLHEVGIAAQDGAYHRPGHWGDRRRPLNLTVQVRWYEAVCRVLREDGLAGVYWWKVDFDANPATASPRASDRFTFVGRPVEQTIRRCFAASP